MDLHYAGSEEDCIRLWEHSKQSVLVKISVFIRSVWIYAVKS